MKKTAGYALLEVVVSIAISAIIITGTAVAFSHAAKFNAMAREKLGAEIAVQNAAEIILAEGYPTKTNIQEKISANIVVVETEPDTYTSKISIRYVKKDKENNDVVVAEIDGFSVKKNQLPGDDL